MPGGVQTEVRTYQMFINGEWVDSKSAKIFPVYDPSTEEVIAQVPDATSDDVNRAVSAAKAAFEEGPWATTTAQERGRVETRASAGRRMHLCPQARRGDAAHCSRIRQAFRRLRPATRRGQHRDRLR